MCLWGRRGNTGEDMIGDIKEIFLVLEELIPYRWGRQAYDCLCCHFLPFSFPTRSQLARGLGNLVCRLSAPATRGEGGWKAGLRVTVCRPYQLSLPLIPQYSFSHSHRDPNLHFHIKQQHQVFNLIMLQLSLNKWKHFYLLPHKR